MCFHCVLTWEFYLVLIEDPKGKPLILTSLEMHMESLFAFRVCDQGKQHQTAPFTTVQWSAQSHPKNSEFRGECVTGVTHAICVPPLESWRKLLNWSLTQFPDGSVYTGHRLIGFLIKCELQQGNENLFHNNEASTCCKMNWCYNNIR